MANNDSSLCCGEDMVRGGFGTGINKESREMISNIETAKRIRIWLQKERGLFSWPTDSCGYDQHIRFVEHRNKNWQGGSIEEFRKFVSDYADHIEKEPE
jgi:hypothetical protein